MARPKEASARAGGIGEPVGLSDDRLRDMYYKMLVARLLGDRMFILNRQGRAHFAITGHGHEACQVGSAFALRAGRDWVLPYYRDMGVVLALGMTTREVMLHFLARAADPCSGGRQMPNHWGYPSLRIVTGSSVVATQIPHAVGVALASKLRAEDDVSIVYFGEGATSQGDFHEGLNFASVHRLPVVFFCENNGYAISEPQWKEMAVPNVSDRARGYGLCGSTVDGNDALAVYQTTRWAVGECRHGRGPSLSRPRPIAWCPTPAPTTTAATAAAPSWRSGRRRTPWIAFAPTWRSTASWTKQAPKPCAPALRPRSRTLSNTLRASPSRPPRRR